jgi:hypothetical protein
LLRDVRLGSFDESKSETPRGKPQERKRRRRRRREGEERGRGRRRKKGPKLHFFGRLTSKFSPGAPPPDPQLGG